MLLDVAALSVLCRYNFKGLVVHGLHLWLYLFAVWCLIAYFSGYYRFYRFTPPLVVAYKVLKQLVLYTAAVVSFFLFARYSVFNGPAIATHIALLTGFSALIRVIAWQVLKKLPLSPNKGSYIIIGRDYAPGLQNPLATFSTPAEAISFAQNSGIGAIYCSLSAVSAVQIDNLRNFGEAAGIRVRFLPHMGMHFPKRVQIDYFEAEPLLYSQKTPLDNPVAQLFKRVFDIVFSTLVIVFIFSWLIPVIALFIKAESQGPVFFKQIRVGKNSKEFWCYKFRSMKVNNSEGKVTVKNDPRITKVGAFLRKTSLDEMPQFINVLLGHMSVVGPRPKIWGHHNQYKDHIHKFMDRLNVKPGITGLAQVSGYRGDINSDAEMQNRIRYDVFYNENWSFLLDIRIIIQTVVNIFMGEEKAF
jgi:putative colanic acid biosysnthesis UDP-glucose lipid carrier transferase